VIVSSGSRFRGYDANGNQRAKGDAPPMRRIAVFASNRETGMEEASRIEAALVPQRTE